MSLHGVALACASHPDNRADWKLTLRCCGKSLGLCAPCAANELSYMEDEPRRTCRHCTYAWRHPDTVNIDWTRPWE